MLSNKNVDTSKWIDFKNSDIFELRGLRKDKEASPDDNGKYPSLTQSQSNNGIDGYNSTFTEVGNFISLETCVSGKTFYQKENVWLSSSADHLMRLTIKDHELNDKIAMFLITILDKKMNGYSYGRKRSKTRFFKENIKLPAKLNSEGIYKPDWEYMEKFIKQKEKDIEALEYVYIQETKTILKLKKD